MCGRKTRRGTNHDSGKSSVIPPRISVDWLKCKQGGIVQPTHLFGEKGALGFRLVARATFGGAERNRTFRAEILLESVLIEVPQTHEAQEVGLGRYHGRPVFEDDLEVNKRGGLNDVSGDKLLTSPDAILETYRFKRQEIYRNVYGSSTVPQEV